MGDYEDMEVDRSIDAAWLDFCARLADHVTAGGDGVCLAVRDGAGDSVVDVVIVEVAHGGHVAEWHWADGLDRCGARHDSYVSVAAGEIAGFAEQVSRVLRAAGAPHPSFVEVVEGDLVLVGPPGETAQDPALLPESITAAPGEELAEWVDRVLTARLGRAPGKREDGSIGISRGHDRVDIRASRSRPIIEVWAVVAEGVDKRKGRKMLDKLNGWFNFFCFSMADDCLIVSTTVNAEPFCPAHLNSALDAVFNYLEKEGAKVRAKLSPVSATGLGTPRDAVDPDLLLIYSARDDRDAMVEMARSVAVDSGARLEQLRRGALNAGHRSRVRAVETTHLVVQKALDEQSQVWTDVVSSIAAAQQALADERDTSR